MILLCCVGLTYLLIPVLLVTRSCEMLLNELNNVAGKLIKIAAEATQESQKEAALHDLRLVYELKRFLQDTNQKQGMGCTILGVRISVPLVKGILVGLTSLF